MEMVDATIKSSTQKLTQEMIGMKENSTRLIAPCGFGLEEDMGNANQMLNNLKKEIKTAKQEQDKMNQTIQDITENERHVTY